MCQPSTFLARMARLFTHMLSRFRERELSIKKKTECFIKTYLCCFIFFAHNVVAFSQSEPCDGLMEGSCCYQWYLFGHFYQSNTLALELVIPGRRCMAFFLLLVLKTNDLPRYQLFPSQSSASSLAQGGLGERH